MYCGKCGARMPDEEHICPICGADMSHSPDESKIAHEDFSELKEVIDLSAVSDPEDVRHNKNIAILAYCSWLVLIPICKTPKSKFARFHANYGLVLAIAETVYLIFEIVLSLYFRSFLDYSFIATALLLLPNAVFIALSILGISSAYRGYALKLPMIGNIKILK